ncbi:DEAD/DEAH box helicase family protein [cf. Phormidesmis sp. LEGE 11477]|uniref:DEAD/DEAH box helicase family protein n=1 Tax=cf. Phormidesmis sp. LEGE 11477 TaxID=1828680 RepID=UPI0018819A87|nr:DEAD/DEAH box helicase family protein [cf. Phormidesmis sp. LEGE 11477]MBE9062884.1 DEAD/DEAH box helicase family protein [cf. Phormidesmis sp. LEGE 11477]
MANYRITDADDLANGGAKTKARQNIAAIKLLKEIERENRSATTEEQAILVRYSGWGAAPDIFTAKSAWAELKGELEELLTEEELTAARASTVNAFYTDAVIAAEIYKGVKQLGFPGGKILDPSLGATGIFEGMMPAEMANDSEIVGIELDDLSGRIASQLYPDADIHIRGFQDTILADDYFDLTISNVPFSEVGVGDPRYKHQPINTLHDYFFAKGLDKLRPGGLMAYITSTGTMQSAKGKPFRQYLSDRANLVGAMRLPGDAFKKNAGTEVTTDLIILQKLGDGVVPNGIVWTELAETDVLDSEGKRLQTNEYYAQRPELMLGTLRDDKLYPGRLALDGDGRDIATAIEGAFATVPSGIYQPQLGLTADATRRILVPPELQSVKRNGFTLYEDKLMQRRGDYLEPTELTGKPYERVIELIGLRDAVQNVFDVQLQQGSDTELDSAQKSLEKTYDSFVQKNGYIHQRGNRLAFRGDPDYPLLLALENYDPEEKTAKKTDIFFKRTIQTYQPKTHAESAKEGLLFSLNEFGKVNISYIAELTSQSRLEVIRDLQKEQLIFKDPIIKEWQTSDEYLSGNVKRKLEVAQEEAEKYSEFTVNVEALQAVQPEPLLPGDIDVRLGSIWIPPSDVEAFAHNLLGVDKGITIQHSKSADAWYVNTTYRVNVLAANNSIYGTGEVSATTLISQTLNLKNPVVYKADPHDADKRVIDQDETAAARLKQEEIKERFKDWIWQDPERTDRLTKVYNETFNTNRERQYDGSHLELPGKNPNFILRQHQADAVYRSLSGNTLLAHAVGAGKTAEMICSGMEQKRLGLADKPMFVVPNHLLEQWAGDIKHLYPTANILAATKEDASKANRQELMARIATGQWDAVVVTHSAFGKLKLSNQSQTVFLTEEHEKVREALLSVDKNSEESRRLMKDLEKKKTKLSEKISAISDSTEKDETITFEQLGVDLLVVDESHYFKNLGYVTKMRNVAGLPNTESQRAFDMHMKVRHVTQVRGEGKGIIFATGTPVTNSMAELYTAQRFLQPEELKRTGVESFDNWASVFGEMVSAAELTASGKFKVTSRFNSFTNMGELMGSVRQFMDIKTADMLDLPVPKLLNGEPTIVAVPATDDQLAYMDDMVQRVENMGNIDPTEDNMLKLTGDGKATSLDPRLRMPGAADDPNSKINYFVRDAYKFWEENRNEKTHLAFCDLGTPKKAGEFSLYQEIKDKLVTKGIPEKEIAFAQSYKTDAQKLQMQKKFNEGKISLLISGSQLETGFNGQARLARISHLTVPWRPDQIEQRDGRMLRQGNRNEVVESRRYITQGRNGQPGMDGYFWQTLEKKAGFISQLMKGDTSVRHMSDISEEALDFATAKAIATGNPLIMEMATLDNTVRQLSSQKRSHINATYRIRRQLKRIPVTIEIIEQNIRDIKIDLDSANQASTAGKITLFDQQLSLSQTEEIGKRIRSNVSYIRPSRGERVISKKIGNLGKFEIYVYRYMDDSPALKIVGADNYHYDKILGSNKRAYEPIRRILEVDIAERLEKLNDQLLSNKDNLQKLSQHVEQPFQKEEELAAATKRLAEVYKELNAETEAQKGKSSDSDLTADGSASDTSADIRPHVAPQSEQESGVTKRVAKFLKAINLQHEVASTEGLYLILKHEERDTDLIIDANDGESIKLTTNVKTGRLPATNIAAVFQLDSSGILTLESAEGGEETNLGELALAARLAHYLSVNKDKFVSSLQATVEADESSVSLSADKSPEVKSGNSLDPDTGETTADSEDAETEEATAPIVSSAETQKTDQPSDLQEVVEAQGAVSGSVTSHAPDRTPAVEAQQSDQTLEEQPSPPPLPEKVQPSAEANREELVPSRESESQQVEPVVLELTSLFSGKKAEITLPPDPDLKSKDHTSPTAAAPEETEPSVTIYESEEIAVTENRERGGIEVRFTEKPSKEWTSKLKTQGFRFSKKDSDPRWWKKTDKVSMPALRQFAEDYSSTVNEKLLTPEADDEAPPTGKGSSAKEAISSEQLDSVRPILRIYLELKAEHPDSVVLIRTPIGHYETFDDDAKLASKELETKLRTIDSKNDRYGRILVNRIFQEKLDDSIERLRQLAPVVVRRGLTELSTYPKLEATETLDPQLPQEAATEGPESRKIAGESEQKSAEHLQPAVTQRLESSFAQTGRAERVIATFLDKAGLSEVVMSGKLHMTVRAEEQSSLRLDIDEVEQTRILSFRQESSQEASIQPVDRSMSFSISGDGLLALQSTAFPDPVGGGKAIEGCDHSFAMSFAKTLSQQNFPEATLEQLRSSGPESGRDSEPETEAVAEELSDQKHNLGSTGAESAEHLVPASELVAAAIASHEPELAAALTDTEPTIQVKVGQLRQWYRAATANEAPPDVLEAIEQKGIVANEFGTAMLSQTEASAMNTALTAEPIEAEEQEGSIHTEGVSTDTHVPASKLIGSIIAKHDPQLADALSNPEPTIQVEVEQLRQWYQAARDKSKSPDLLEAIRQKGEVAKEQGSVEVSRGEASEMNADLVWLAEHHPESEPVSLEILREWWQANTVVAKGNYRTEIEAIAAPLKQEGVAEVAISRADRQRMNSDVRAFHSVITEGALTIWEELKRQNKIGRTPEGAKYTGINYTISRSSDALRITHNATNREFKLNGDQVEANTLSVTDVQTLRALSQRVPLERHKEVQH